jgi:hypothetical protein
VVEGNASGHNAIYFLLLTLQKTPTAGNHKDFSESLIEAVANAGGVVRFCRSEDVGWPKSLLYCGCGSCEPFHDGEGDVGYLWKGGIELLQTPLDGSIPGTRSGVK